MSGQPHLLTATAEGGLCNRFRVVFGARYLADCDESLQVRVCWQGRGWECAARFSDLFESVDTARFRVTDCPFPLQPLRPRNLYLPMLLRKLQGYDCQLNHANPGNGLLAHALADNGKVYISTCYALADMPYGYLRPYLRPVASLRRRIEEITSRFDKQHAIGVHIRRTDNVNSIKYSTDEVFLDAFDRAIAADPQAQFFLATDDDAFKSRLVEKYRGRILTQQAENRRDTRGGIECAVVDLFCLSATARILGSYSSSFSEIAAEIGGIDLEVVKKK